MTAVATPTLHTTEEHPFPGLRPFDFGDAEYFFGGERSVNSIYRLIEFSRFIAVIGSSGSGKSSLVRAGLWPLLERERSRTGGRRWLVDTMHPGRAPALELAKALARLAKQSVTPELLERLENSTFALADVRKTFSQLGDDPIFLIVDQFEELFRYAAPGGVSRSDRATQAIWRERAAHFVELLLTATRAQEANIFVLITMRSDFIGDCAQFEYLPQAVSATQFLVPALTRDQREAIICKPIEKAATKTLGACIDAALVDRLLNDAGDEADQLPVLQHCLARLWERSAPDHRISLATYADIGTIEGALSQHADELMDGKDLRGKTLAVEQVFRALSEVDKEGRATRRPIKFEQLAAETGVPEPDVRTVVNRFRADDCSFCTPSFASVPQDELKPDTTIDVGHEALLRKWKKISRTPDQATLETRNVGWLWLEKRDGDTYEWLLNVAAAKAGSILPSDQVDDRLEWWHSRPRTAAWADRYGGRIDRVEQLFSDSVAAVKEERARQAREERDRVVRRRQVIALFTLLPITFAAIGLGMLLWAQSVNKETAALRAQNNIFAASAAVDRQQALAFGLTANQSKISAAAERKKAEQYWARAQQLERKTHVQDQTIKTTNSALESSIATLHVSDEKLLSEVHAEEVASAKTFLATGISALQQGDAADAEVFLAAAYHKDPRNGAASILLESARDQVQSYERAISLPGGGGPILSAAYTSNPRDTLFAAGQANGAISVWNRAGNRRAYFKQSDGVTALTFDPSGDVLATGGRDGSLMLRFLNGGNSVVLDGHHERINSIVFSPTGNAVATTAMDGTVKLWSVDRQQLLHEFDLTPDADGFPAVGYDLKFTPDGTKLLACTNRAMQLWDLRGYQELHFQPRTGEPAGPPGCRHIAVSGDGTRAVTDGDLAGAVEFYSLSTPDWNSHPPDWNGRNELAVGITALAYDPTGKHIVVAGENGSVAETDGSMRLTPLLHHRGSTTGTGSVVAADFSSDGSTLLIAQADGTVSIYDLASDSNLTLRAQDIVSNLSVASGNGFVTTGETNGIPNFVLWHVPSPANSILSSARSAAITTITPIPHQNLFATGSLDGVADLWKAGSEIRHVATLDLARDAWVDQLHADDTGTWLAATGGRHIRVWNIGDAPRLDTDVVSSSDYLRFSDAWPTHSGDLILAQRKETEVLSYHAVPPSEQGLGVRSRSSGKILMDSDWLTNATDVLPVAGGKAVVISRAWGYAQFTTLKDLKTYFTYSGISQAAYCPGTDRVVLGGTWGGLSLVSAKNASRLRYWQDHRPVLASGAHERVAALACSDNGAWVASSGTPDGLIRVWNVARVLHTPAGVRPSPYAVLQLGYPVEVSLIRFSPGDGRFILTLTPDGRTQLWNRESGAPLETFALPNANATAAAFVSNGNEIAVGYSDGQVAVYPLSSSTAVSKTMHDVLVDIKGLQIRAARPRHGSVRRN